MQSVNFPFSRAKKLRRKVIQKQLLTLQFSRDKDTTTTSIHNISSTDFACIETEVSLLYTCIYTSEQTA